MDDLETIKKYIKYYKLNLIEKEDFDYSYTQHVESEIVTNKKFNKLLLKSNMLRKILKNTNTVKNLSKLSYLWGCDYMFGTERIHPPYFILQFEPKSREVISYSPPPIVKWESEPLPSEPIEYERIHLPFREYMIRDRGNTTFMDMNDDESHAIKCNGGYTLIRHIVKPTVNIKKVYNGFVPVFTEMGLDISFSTFEEFYKVKELHCELLPTEDEEHTTVREVVENWRDLIIKHQMNYENDTPHNILMDYFVRREDVQRD